MSNFEHPKVGQGTISIGVVHESDGGPPGPADVHAQYNPKELQVDKTVPWQKNPQANKSPQKGIQLEFTGAEGRSMSVELLFDGYETKTSVAPQIDALNQMASPRQAGSSDENKRRPFMCVVTWGATIPSFRCVIESLSTKYTMFSDDGTPLRATCTVKLKEADTLSMAKDDNKAGGTTAPSGGK